MTSHAKILFLLSLLALFSCHRQPQYPYSIKDFRTSIRPFLTLMVNKGIVTYYDSARRSQVTDAELWRLGKSEHPVLRAWAFNEMFERGSVDQFTTVMSHLDDTAFVIVDMGEFGLDLRTVSDHILAKAEWPTAEQKERTIDVVLNRHNYLRGAYSVLGTMAPQEKHYAIIKRMALETEITEETGAIVFSDVECALKALALYKKKEDVQEIAGRLQKDIYEITYRSLQLMRDFPDTAYFPILRKYYQRFCYQFTGRRRGGFTGYKPDPAEPEDFIEALVMQKSTGSAQLLDSMLTKLPQETCLPYQEDIIRELMKQIWDHPCPAYVNLRRKLQSKVNWLDPPTTTIQEPMVTTLDTKLGEQKMFRWSY